MYLLLKALSQLLKKNLKSLETLIVIISISKKNYVTCMKTSIFPACLIQKWKSKKNPIPTKLKYLKNII